MAYKTERYCWAIMRHSLSSQTKNEIVTSFLL